jgi:hypothetical protein
MIAVLALVSSLSNLLLAAFINNKLDEVIKSTLETKEIQVTEEGEIV